MTNAVLSHANKLAEAVIARARELGHHVSAVCTDRSGAIIAAQRMDLAAGQLIETARRKAVTSAAMGAPTSLVAGMVSQDSLAQQALAATPDMLPVPGGAPLVVDAIVVGGIGVAGGHYSEDDQILQYALAQVQGAAQ